MKQLTEIDLNEIFGAPVPDAPIFDTAPDYAAEAVERLFMESRGHLVPDFDMFPIAGVRDTDGDVTPDSMIFESFDTRRMIEEILDGTQYTHGYKSRGVYNEAGVLMRKLDGANGRKLTDEEFDAAIDFRLRQISVRDAGDISPAQAVSERFQRFGVRTDAETAAHTQLDRMLFEEGQLVDGQVKIVQLRTGDQTPTHHRPELIRTWARCSFAEAVFLVKCYKYLDVTFEIQRHLNRLCAVRECQHPANVILSDWTDAVSVHDRMKKIESAAGPKWREAARWGRSRLRTKSDSDFEEKYPEGQNKLFELAKAMKDLAGPHFEEPVESKDTDLFTSVKSTEDRYDIETEDGLHLDSSEVSVDRFGEIHDRFEPIYVNPDGSPIVIMETGHGDEDDTIEYIGPDDAEFDGGRDSEAFGYWHMSVIPTDLSLTGTGVKFYLKAQKALWQTKSLKRLNRLRECIFKAAPPWNYTQKTKFWASYRQKKAEIQALHRLIREQRAAK